MGRIILYTALTGGFLPFLIFLSTHVPMIASIWWWQNIILIVWPSYYMMLGFAGPFNLMAFGALVISAFVNAIIYASVAAVLCAVIKMAAAILHNARNRQ